jgi:hypothetical protein
VHINVDGDKIDLVIPDADEWVEGIDMTEYETYNNNRIQFENIWARAVQSVHIKQKF